MRIDAHQHFWRLERGDYGWLTPAMTPLYRDFGPEDLRPMLARHRIDKTILVQAAPTVAETRFMLDIAARTPFVAGVVGWVDFEAADVEAAIGRLAAEPLLVGLRPMVQDIGDDEWIARRALAPALRAMASNKLVFDALVLPRHLAPLLAMLDRHPDLIVVIDHGAKPRIGEGRIHPWQAEMTAVAARPSTLCKLSGLVTEAGEDWDIARLRPYVDHLLTIFGPTRLIWGSDWPVVALAGGYDRWMEAAETLLGELKDAGRDAIFGGNAARIYLARKKPP